jgi:hypothetical protein
VRRRKWVVCSVTFHCKFATNEFVASLQRMSLLQDASFVSLRYGLVGFWSSLVNVSAQVANGMCGCLKDFRYWCILVFESRGSLLAATLS